MSMTSSRWYLVTAEPFATKLGMVLHHCEPECCLKRLVCCLQGQSHYEDMDKL